MAPVADDDGVTFEGLANFRDVGKTVNNFLGAKIVKEGLLFRSGRPDEATPADRERLIHEFDIKMIMDLRTKTEHLNAAKKRDADSAVPALLQSNAALAEPVQIPGVKYLEVRLTGRSFERFLVAQLTWWSFFKLIILFIFGYRMQAISIMGAEVMKPMGLTGLARATIDSSGPELRQALSSLLNPWSLPLLVHCTQGKDRTGIIIAFVLMILGVDLQAIDHDYHLSARARLGDAATPLAEIREIGLPDEFGDTARGLIHDTACHLEDKYGGLDAYLDGIGFGDSERERLREILLY